MKATFAVKIHARAKKNAITSKSGDVFKVDLTVPRVEGRAKTACVEFFAELLKVPRSSISIVMGESSRNKVIQVEGISEEELTRRLQ